MASLDPELHLYFDGSGASDWRRWRAAGIGSGATHVFLFLYLLSFDGTSTVQRPPERTVKPIVIPLYTPRDLTQKAANKAPISKEIVAPTIAPRPVLRAQAPAPVARAAAPVPPPSPVVEAKKTAPSVIEPPKIETPAQPTNSTGNSALAQINPLQSVEKPKLVLENAAPPPKPSTARPNGSLLPPSTSVQDAIKELAHGSAKTGLAVGDVGSDSGSLGPGLNLPPSAGRPRSSLELKSDPMGVDFRPYLLQALAAVRRNWFAVYPEAARLGQRGQVVLQFAIVRQGNVAKVIYTTESGSRALDQAAVAAISASNPLPPLPADFKGDRIVLQMTFLYNMAK